ncbi:YacL family protein [Shewanella avicenniae]|uniref:YacL family protein n=1 Tax=Shewanella avicenniae TaxID=2814294 RepID=A0ABX7QTT4_9GAMM|nr:YacL family protein [Shewanella avicenniae]QSX34432.1 YacL family protein [Shewanella avicenniae]
MEYEFRRDIASGAPWASFSMEHQIMGQWFSEELGNDNGICEQVKRAIEQLQHGKLNDWQLVGGDLTLQMDTEQVRIYANVLDFESDADIEENMSLYDAESEAYCGLEDFEQVLDSWQRFIAER